MSETIECLELTFRQPQYQTIPRHRPYPKLIAQNIISVQPLQPSLGLHSYLSYRSSSKAATNPKVAFEYKEAK